ncbi:hypothetical protein GCM10022221_35990 [Actinocorallia aurea]
MLMVGIGIRHISQIARGFALESVSVREARKWAVRRRSAGRGRIRSHSAWCGAVFGGRARRLRRRSVSYAPVRGGLPRGDRGGAGAWGGGRGLRVREGGLGIIRACAVDSGAMCLHTGFKAVRAALGEDA